MTYYDYQKALELAAMDVPFYALIQAAMRKADSTNIDLLRAAWPNTYNELLERRNAPGGYLKGEHRGTETE